MTRWQQFSPPRVTLIKFFIIIILKILGRLLQVEYAINNINNAGLCLGLVTSGGNK